MTHEVTRADKVAAEGWAREQSPGLQMMLVKPRGLHEAFAAHRIAHEAPLLARIAELEGVLSALMSRQSVYAHMFGRAVAAFGVFAELLKLPDYPKGTVAYLMEAAQKQAQADADTIAQQEEWVTARAALKQEPGT